jgi:hypothetical protein
MACCPKWLTASLRLLCSSAEQHWGNVQPIDRRLDAHAVFCVKMNINDNLID